MTVQISEKKEGINWTIVFLIIIVAVGIHYRSKSVNREIPADTRKQLPDSILKSPEDLDSIASLMEEYEKKKAVTESEMSQTTSEIKSNPKTDADYSENIAKCNQLKQLSLVHYNDSVEFSRKFAETALKYFPSAESVMNNLDEARKDTMGALVDLMNARIDYYQARLGKDSEAIINEKHLVINEKINQLQEKIKAEGEAEAKYHNEFDRIFEN